MGTGNNVSLQINVDELTSLNDQVVSSRNDIETTMQNVQTACDEIKANIQGAQVHNSLTSIYDSITTISSKMGTAFDDLTAFLTSQLQQYALAYENADVNLHQALQFIENNF